MKKTFIVNAIDKTIMTREEFRNFLINAVEDSDVTTIGSDTLRGEVFPTFLRCCYCILDVFFFDATDRNKIYDYFIDRVLENRYKEFFPIEIEV